METKQTNQGQSSKTTPTLSLHLRAEDFLPASHQEKEQITLLRPSVTFWQDGMKRFGKNPVALASLFVIILIGILAFVVPSFYPYDYKSQIRGHENLKPMQWSAKQQELRIQGEFVWPHVLGTDDFGRDLAIRLMIGTRISLIVGLIASTLVLIIGATIGSIAGYFGGKIDLFLSRVIDIIYTIPDLLIIILLSTSLKKPLEELARKVSFFSWIGTIGVPLISIFIVFSLLYWVGMARIIRGQILSLKEQDFVSAARALGATHGQIIRKHLLLNSVGILIVTTTLQIPAAIFTESFLSFLGLGVSAPIASLGSLASDALGGLQSYPHRLLAPAIAISLIILSFNLLGDGLRDAFDPKLKQ